ncbi:MAG: SMP-30/gluconolactonase/LRE family protein [Melioribacteraceae bacterium]
MSLIENKINIWVKIFFIILFVIVLNSKIFTQIVIDPNVVVEEIAKDIQQPEGPVWNDSLGLLFSDIKDNKIYKWSDGNGKEIYLNDSDSTNGLAYDLEGRLVAGQMGLRRIVRFEKDGSQTSIADKYEGKRFSSPNDLVVKSDGSIFFTDPDFNIPVGQKKELSFNGIYRISKNGNLQLLATLALPNGICFSPNETKLYVNDSQAHKIYVWDVVDDSTITNKKLFFTIPVNGYADGMKTDSSGNIYCTCSSAVWVISPDCEQIGKINLPSNVSASNCAWGEDDRKTLFITAGKSVYKTRPIITGIDEQSSVIPNKIKLYQNYPNPFNPTTNIKYSIPQNGFVTLKLFDVLGEEIKTLQNRFLQQGNYSIALNSKGLSSGVYFYRLELENYTETKKLIITK